MKEFIAIDKRRMIIRENNKEDASDVLAYMHQMLGETDYLSLRPEEFTFTEEQEKRAIRSYLETPNRVMISAIMDDQIVGMLTFDSGSRERVRHTGIVGVSVLKAYWGNGVASALFDYLLDWAKGNGVTKKINLSVREDNVRAIELYKRLGFIIEGEERMKHFTNGCYYSSIHMGLIL